MPQGMKCSTDSTTYFFRVLCGSLCAGYNRISINILFYDGRVVTLVSHGQKVREATQTTETTGMQWVARCTKLGTQKCTGKIHPTVSVRGTSMPGPKDVLGPFSVEASSKQVHVWT